MFYSCSFQLYNNSSVLDALIFFKIRRSNNQLVDTLTRSLSICLIGYRLTDADMKGLQSYLESLEPDRHPLVTGNKYMSLLLYIVVVVPS